MQMITRHMRRRGLAMAGFPGFNVGFPKMAVFIGKNIPALFTGQLFVLDAIKILCSDIFFSIINRKLVTKNN